MASHLKTFIRKGKLVCFFHTDNIMVQLSYEGTPRMYKCGATLLLADPAILLCPHWWILILPWLMDENFPSD